MRGQTRWSPVLAQRAVSEDPGWTRAVEDQSVPIPEEITNEIGGIICSLARRPQYDQYGCHSLEESMDLIRKWETDPTEDRNEKEM
jgi:hypothetical protein